MMLNSLQKPKFESYFDFIENNFKGTHINHDLFPLNLLDEKEKENKQKINVFEDIFKDMPN